MAPAPKALPLDRSFDPQVGKPVEVATGIVRVTAPNAGPYTFTGTNTYLIGDSRLLLIDPGPNDQRHFAALQRAINGRPVEAVLLTHTHRDHAALARQLAHAVDAPIRFSHRHRLFRKASWLERLVLHRSCDFRLVPDIPIAEGETIAVDGIALSALATPGHCENHMAFGLIDSPYLLDGDHVMGWSSTVISPPDGALAPYFASLEHVIAAPYMHYLPGHGGSIADGRGFAQALLLHRRYRNEQVLDGIKAGDNTSTKLLRRIYPDLSANLLPAAKRILQAHLDYLVETGAIKAIAGKRYSLG